MLDGRIISNERADLKNQFRVVVPHEELERRLGSVEDSIAEVIRTIKESEDRTHLRMLQWENRLLDRILSNGFKMSNPSNSFSFPEKTTNASPPVYNDGPSQNFSYAKSLACNDNNQWMIVPRQDMEYDFASKYRILYQHGPQAPSESLIPLAGSAPNQPTASQPVDWNAGGFGSVDLSVPNISGVANVFDFFNPSQAD